MSAQRRTATRWWTTSRAMVTLGLIVTGSFGGLVLAEHANELLGQLGEVGEAMVPGSGNESADEARRDTFDEYETLRREPQVPANYFYSSAGNDLRIGGFGEWSYLAGASRFASPGGGRRDWNESTAYPFVGDWGFSFGNEPGGRYRTASYDAYYVSPKIDLRSLTFSTSEPQAQVSPGPTSVPVPRQGPIATVADLAGAPRSAHLNTTQSVTLRLQHKFNFALAQDGARVEVFLQEPSVGVPTTPEAVLAPKARAEGESGTLATPEAQNYRATAAFNGGSAFTGKHADWGPAAFDLGPFLGKEIYVVLHVKTKIPAPLSPIWFEDPKQERFPNPRPGFWGWKVDAVQVEGPAHPRNLRVRSLDSPAFSAMPAGEPSYPVGAGPLRGNRSVFSAVIENRGSATETGIPVDFGLNELRSGGIRIPHRCETTSPGLPPGRVLLPTTKPGGNVEITMRCDSFPLEGRNYEVAVRVGCDEAIPDTCLAGSGNGSPADGDSGDNVLKRRFVARTLVNFQVLKPFGVEPSVGDTDQLRGIEYQARNGGNDDFAVMFAINVQRQDQDGTFSPPTAKDVEFVGGNGQPRSVIVPIGQAVEERWEFILRATGTYLVSLVGTNLADGRSFLNATFRVTADESLGVLLFDDQSGARPSGRFVGNPDYWNWTVGEIWPPSPPDDGAYWRLVVNETRKGNGPRSELGILAGKRTDLASLDATLEFQELEVRIRHHLDVGRAASMAAGLRQQQSLNWGSHFQVLLAPLEAVGFSISQDTNNNPPTKPGPALVRPAAILLQSINGTSIDRDRERFYRIQWVEESYRVSPGDFAQGLTSIPASFLGVYRLEAAALIQHFHNGGSTLPGAISAFCRKPATGVPPVDSRFPADYDPSIGLPGDCPAWWVDEVVVTAVPTDPSKPNVTWLRTTGNLDGTEDVGTWTSESYAADRYLGYQLPSQNVDLAFPFQNAIQKPTTEKCLLQHRDGFSDGEDIQSNVEKAEDIAHGCPLWERSDARFQVSSSDRWGVTDRISTGGQYVRWMGDHALIGQKKVYSVAYYQHAMLSPTVQIPAGTTQAALSFAHKYSLHAPKKPDEVQDYAGVYVQFMKRQDKTGEPVPDSPFFELPIRGAPGPVPPPPDLVHVYNSGYQSHAFVGDCGAPCRDMGSPVAQPIDFTLGPNLRFLNYLDVNARSAKGFDSGQGLASHRLDALAYQLGNRSILGGPLVRFAFVMATYNGMTATANFNEGWAMGPILLKAGQRLGHDVRLNSVRLGTAYDQTAGLGPGTEATLVVNVTNVGLFTRRQVEVQVEFTKHPENVVSQVEILGTAEDFNLKSDQDATLAFQIRIPSEEGLYTVHVTALIPTRGDENPGDNCASVNLLQFSGTRACLTGTPLVTVRAHPDASIEASVAPLAGRVDNPAQKVFFPRTTFVTVHNRGNVPLSGIVVERSVSRFITGPSGESQLTSPERLKWGLSDLLQPGSTTTLDGAARRIVEAQPPQQNEFSLNFAEEGRYVVRFAVFVAGDQDPDNDEARILLDAWEVFYSADFEPGGRGETRSGVVTGDWRAGGAAAEAWGLTDARSFVAPNGEGQRSYWFGQPANLTYPDSSSAWLQIPQLDLTSASQAFLNFRSKYLFEPGYDGGIVEASTDAGRTWFPINPKPHGTQLLEGYSGPLVASNPLNPTSDPLVQVRAFTGDSGGIDSGSDWVPLEFDLAKEVSSYRQDLLVVSFDQVGFPREAPGTPAIIGQPHTRTNDLWVLPDGSCGNDSCWYAENVAASGPKVGFPLYWWTGVDGSSRLTLNLKHPDLRLEQFAGEKTAELSWWQYQAVPDASGSVVEPSIPPDNAGYIPELRETRGPWQRFAYVFTAKQKASDALTFVYSPGTFPHQRGWAITNVTLAAFDDLPGGFRANLVQKPIPLVEGTGIWSPSTGPPLPSPRSLSSAVWTGSGALVVGGLGVLGPSADILGFQASGSLVALTPLTSARYGTAAATQASYAYVFGGRTAAGASSQILRVPLSGGATVVSATLPSPRANASAAENGQDQIFVFGGEGASLFDDILQYNTTSNTVTNMKVANAAAHLPTARTGTSAVRDGDNIYVFGGSTSQGLTDQIVRFNHRSTALTVLGDLNPPVRLPAPLAYGSAVWDGQHAYIIGGQTASGPSAQIVRFTPATGSVVVLHELPQALAGSSAVWDGQANAYIFGGQAASGPTASVFRYTPLAGRVETVERACGGPCTGAGWRPTSDMGPADVGWRIAPGQTTHEGRVEPVWVFRNANPKDAATGTFQVPRHADDRLVTPAIDLSKVVGSAKATFWQRGGLDAGNMRFVEIQVLDRLSAPATWGPWRVLTSTTAGLSLVDWNQAAGIELSPYSGERVRLGFRVQTGRSPGNADVNAGWFLNGIEVRGETMVGGSLLLRFHAGTDASINEGGWGIDNVEIVGRTYSAEPGNVAVVLDTPSPNLQTAPGTRVWFNGTVRNLSPKIWIGKAVVGELSLPDGTVPLEAHLPTNLAKPEGKIGPFALQLPGQVDQSGKPTDRFSFSFSAIMPPQALEQITATLRIVDAETGEYVRDENLGDHTAVVRIATTSNILPLQIDDARITPQDPDPGSNAHIRMRFENPGTVAMATQLTPTIRDTATGATQTLETKTLHLEGQTVSQDHDWQWKPATPGIYALDVTSQATFLTDPPVTAAPLTTFVQYLFVGQSLIFESEEFDEVHTVLDDDGEPFPAEWRRGFGPGNCLPSGQQVASTNLWAPTDEHVLQSDQSLFSGVTDLEFFDGKRYPANLDDELRQPPVDLSDLVDPGRFGSPVVTPVFLNFWHRTITEADRDGLKVQARHEFPSGAFEATRQHLTPSPCTGPGLLSGVDDDWKPRSYAITQLVKPERRIQFLYRFLSDAPPNPPAQPVELQGVWLDSVSVSAYNAIIEPPIQTFHLVDNAQKVFNVKVTNVAPVRDSFVLTIDPLATSFPAQFGTIEISPQVLTLPAGASGVARVHVNTSLDRNLPASGEVAIGILAVSLGDPNRLARARIDFPLFAPRTWPDLVAEWDKKMTEGLVVNEAEPTSFLATVSNFGLATNPAAQYRLYACPDPLSDADCTKASTKNKLLVQAGPVPPIRPFRETNSLPLSQILVTGTWKPPDGARGTHRLLLLVDPDERVTDYDRTNNRAEAVVQVNKLLRPDLRIKEFQVLDGTGNPVTTAVEGEVIQIRATVENAGDKAASDVTIRLINRFVLRELHVLTLLPGQSVEISTSWVATAGTSFIRAVASTLRDPELSLENNAQLKKLVVWRNDLSLDLAEERLVGSPGDSWNVPLTLVNKGDNLLELRLRASAPSGIQASVAPEDLVIGISESLPGLLQIRTEGAEPGRYLVTVEATSADSSGSPFTVALEVDLRGTPRVQSARSASGVVSGLEENLMLSIRNTGSLAARYAVRTHAPQGWSVRAEPPVVELEAGTQQQVRFTVRAPPGYLPGDYVIRVSFDGEAPPDDAFLHVTVPRLVAFDVDTLRESASLGLQEWLVRIRNAGNVEAVPDLALATSETGIKFDAEPPLGTLQPGEARIHKIRLLSAGPSAPPARSVLVAGIALVPAAAATETDASAGLTLDRFTLTPRGSPAPDQRVLVDAFVRNNGGVRVPGIPVALFDNGLLVDIHGAEIPPGGTQTVRLGWTAQAGTHVLAVAVDPFESLALPSREDQLSMVTLQVDEPTRASIPSVDPVSLLVLALAVAAVVGRRRRT